MDRIEGVVCGGCQCGAVRYRTTAMLDNSHLCHCRMCQKAVGNVFAALVAAPREALEWTRGEPRRFMSSASVARGFCGDCGTPLFYDNTSGNRVNLTIGSLDEPGRFPPKGQVGLEARLEWMTSLDGVEEIGATSAALEAITLPSSRQHPDHDTERWPE